jgi:hypothetical protein
MKPSFAPTQTPATLLPLTDDTQLQSAVADLRMQSPQSLADKHCALLAVAFEGRLTKNPRRMLLAESWQQPVNSNESTLT